MMRCVKLAAVPEGMPRESDFAVVEMARPTCGVGEVLVETRWLSVDPYIRGRISGVQSYIHPILVGAVMESSCVGVVVESRADGFVSGDWVAGFWGWQEYASVSARGLRKLNPQAAPVTTALGILGMPGMTAYFGLTELCQPKAGETVFVSGAAGAVGSAVGQIAKILGCKVVGSAGSAKKVEYVKSIGFDFAFDYHTERDYLEILKELCPEGIDCYFDNVGGSLTDAVISAMNRFGRVAVCGQIAQYNDWKQDVGPRPFGHIITKQLRLEGFIVSRWAGRFPDGIAKMAEWLRQGKLQYEETIYDGLEQAPRAFMGLFRGENTGKSLVRVIP